MRDRSSAAFAAGVLLLAGASLSACATAEAEVNELASASTVAEVAPTALATGLVGVAYGQEARLHVTRMIPPEPVAPVELVLGLIHADGTIAAQRRVALEPGESAHLTTRGPRGTGSRLLLRAAISQVGDAVTVNPPDDGSESGDPADDMLARGGVQATLEIVDVETGWSRVIVNPVVIKGFNPQPEPPAMPAR